MKQLMIARRFAAVAAIASLGFFGAIILAKARSQNAAEPDRAQHTRFDARDRENIGEWYKEHQENLPRGFREDDRLPSNRESRLRVGEVLDSDLRSRTQPVPSDLLEKLPAPPRDYRYLVLDGHLLLVQEKTWNVSDVLHFEVDFGRP
jgi:Ni/Co efflux regulator RcnB